MRLSRRPEPFGHPDWIFEIKYDGFGALCFVGNARLVSRNGNTFASFHQLAADVAADFRGDNSVLDGEIVSLDAQGQPQFEDLMFRRGELFFVAFDALWINGEDLRGKPLMERKRMLRRVVPRRTNSRLRYLDHVEERGCDLFRVVCENNLEGIVAKHSLGIYDDDARKPGWIKIKNLVYTQAEGREELFEELRT
jgi:bifunctional non-homologous end joining protein LigD